MEGVKLGLVLQWPYRKVISASMQSRFFMIHKMVGSSGIVAACVTVTFMLSAIKQSKVLLYYGDDVTPCASNNWSLNLYPRLLIILELNGPLIGYTHPVMIHTSCQYPAQSPPMKYHFWYLNEKFMHFNFPLVHCTANTSSSCSILWLGVFAYKIIKKIIY